MIDCSIRVGIVFSYTDVPAVGLKVRGNFFPIKLVAGFFFPTKRTFLLTKEYVNII